MYDVIIVGAGPAGAAAAQVLATAGKKVLIVETFSLPRYKSCSGQVIKKSIDLVKKYFDDDVPDFVTCAPSENRGTIVYGENGTRSCFEQSALNVWRSEFDFWLVKKSVSHGAELRDNTIAISCKDDGTFVTVTLKKKGEQPYTETARFVIICEGVAGNLKRKITGCKIPLVTTFQTFNKGEINLDPYYFYAFLQKDFSEYDAWFNVKDNLLVIGVAVFHQEKIGEYYNRFVDFLKNEHGLKITEEVKSEKWLLPQVRPDFKIDHGTGRILFAGESAGFLNPMGEGISSALESGHLAACAVVENFSDTELAVKKYAESTVKLQAYMHRQWQLVERL